jgi:hypothetical protein
MVRYQPRKSHKAIKLYAADFLYLKFKHKNEKIKKEYGSVLF